MASQEPSVRIEDLLAHAQWVHALARTLVADVNVADDVVQQTWLAGLRSPPRSLDAVRPWLARVVRNFAREAYRSGRTRAGLERRAARREGIPSTDELYAQAERQRRVVAAVLTLPDKYGEVVLLRFHAELPPRRIAAHLGVPVETVRTRLRRALDMLKEKLQTDADREGTTWLALVAPLAGHVAPTGTAAARRRWTRPLPLAAGVVAAAGLVAIGVVSLRAPQTSLEGLAALPRATSDRSSDARGRARSAGSTQPEAETAGPREQATEAAAPRGSTLRVVLDVRGGARSVATGEGIVVRATPLFDDHPTPEDAVRTATGRDGALDVDLDGLDGVVAFDLVPDSPSLVPLPSRIPVLGTRARATAPVAATFFAAAIVTGRVEGGAGAIVAGFRSEPGPGAATAVDTATPGADGSFRLRLWPGEAHWIVAAAPDREPVGRLVTTDANTALDLGVLGLQAGRELRGQVHVEEGGALPATLRVTIDAEWSPLELRHQEWCFGVHGDRVRYRNRSVVTSADGAFRVGGLGEGALRVTVAGCGLAGDVGQRLARTVEAPAQGVDFALPPATIVLRLPDLVEGTKVAAEPVNGIPMTLFRPADATFEVRATPGNAYRFQRIDPDGTKTETTARAAARGEPPVEVALERPRSPDGPRPEVVIAVPAPVALVGIGVFRGDAPPRSIIPLISCDVPVIDGLVRVELPAAGRWRLVARPGAAWSQRGDFLEERTVVEARADQPSRWTLAAERGGRVRIALRGASGRPVGATCRVLRGDAAVEVLFLDRDVRGTGASSATLSRSGITEVATPLAAGSYVLELGAPGPVTRVPFEVRAGEETLVEATVR